MDVLLKSISFSIYIKCYEHGKFVGKKQAKLARQAQKVAQSVEKRRKHPHASLRSKVQFFIFRKMQSSSHAAWNPIDRDWWESQGWTRDTRPWE